MPEELLKSVSTALWFSFDVFFYFPQKKKKICRCPSLNGDQYFFSNLAHHWPLKLPFFFYTNYQLTIFFFFPLNRDYLSISNMAGQKPLKSKYHLSKISPIFSNIWFPKFYNSFPKVSRKFGIDFFGVAFNFSEIRSQKRGFERWIFLMSRH